MSDRLDALARSVWQVAELLDRLEPVDLRDPGIRSVADAVWRLADDFDAAIEQATSREAQAR